MKKPLAEREEAARRLKGLGYPHAANAVLQGSCPFRHDHWDIHEQNPDLFLDAGRWLKAPKFLKTPPVMT